jgi:hypothetical protein
MSAGKQLRLEIIGKVLAGQLGRREAIRILEVSE